MREGGDVLPQKIKPGSNLDPTFSEFLIVYSGVLLSEILFASFLSLTLSS